ncbi:MAG: hypothetical protein ACTS8H_01075 [Arsenophonus sp. NC-PE1-MAG3]
MLSTKPFMLVGKVLNVPFSNEEAEEKSSRIAGIFMPFRQCIERY